MYLYYLLEKIKDDDNDEMIVCLIIIVIFLENFFGKLQEIEYFKSKQLLDLYLFLVVRFFDILLLNFFLFVKVIILKGIV